MKTPLAIMLNLLPLLAVGATGISETGTNGIPAMELRKEFLSL